MSFLEPPNRLPARLEETALDATYAGKAVAAVDALKVGTGTTPYGGRVPFDSQVKADATKPGTEDFVAHLLSTKVVGDFTGVASTNPGWVWGANLYTQTGLGANDAKGVTYLTGALVEASIAGTGFTGTAFGLMAEAAFIGQSAGGHLNNMTSLKVGIPKRKDGATAGTATSVYGLFVDAVAPGTLGSTEAYTLFVEGGISRFAGPLQAYGGLSTPAAEGIYIGNRRLTDNGTTLMYDGAPVARDTAETITPNAGFTYSLNKVRKTGNVVTISFAADKASIAVNDVIGTLPAGYRPTADTYAAGQAYAGSFAMASFKVSANGNIVCTVLPASTTGVQGSLSVCV